MYQNLIRFPCPNDGEMTTIDKCDECLHKDECDTYVTILNEPNDTFDS